MAKKKVPHQEPEDTAKFSVYVPLTEHREWKALLAKDDRKQAPVVLGWIREHLAGNRELPVEALPEGLADADPEELRLFARLLVLYRRDNVTKEVVKTWVRARK